mgnify:CR=1 FL=1|tara:strand:- start:2818 stop:3099 length:282 start_codon:yes stop_codon:yes gene_type:complete
MLKFKQLNALNLFDIRRFEVLPPHFEFICIPMKYNLEDSLSKWIEDNLKGRYYLGKTLSIDNNNQTIVALKIGFEEAKELSYFTLACPHLKYT